MKKLTVWALLATLVVAGSAFALPGNRGIVANATYPTGAPTTTNNDDSCDIGTAPAATLLLPYFEVDIASRTGENTLFTITNVSRLPQIAHVTLWTDWSFPVLDFNIFLTGYDVQSVSLYDVIVGANGQGILPATTSDSDEQEEGRRSALNTANPLLTLTDCDNLARRLRPTHTADIQSALTVGRWIQTAGGCPSTVRVGSTHEANLAKGYVTIDVANRCSASLPTDAGYFTTEVLFDNVLIGDYQQINNGQNFAQGNPMVHIRAIPEGGAPGALTTNFDRTFYSRYQAGGTADRRQPLPSTFAARWIEGGTGQFQTTYKIWREGVTGTATCTVSPNGFLTVTELVRFDEEENPTTFTPDEIVSPVEEGEVSLPEASRTSVSDGIYPPNDEDAIAGWMYLNLDSGVDEAGPLNVASQNWVIVSMRAQGIYSVDFDAAWLGNGCSPVEPVTDEDGGDPAIGPADNVTPDL